MEILLFVSDEAGHGSARANRAQEAGRRRLTHRRVRDERVGGLRRQRVGRVAPA